MDRGAWQSTVHGVAKSRTQLSTPLTKADIFKHLMGFPSSSDGKESASNGRDLGSVSGLGRSPGEGNSNQLQYSCLENSVDRGAWQAIVYGVTKSQTQLSDFHFHIKILT